MQKFIFSFLFLMGFSIFVFAQKIDVTYSVSPASFDENEQITITFTNINETSWGTQDLYLWSWGITTDNASHDSVTNGSWGSSNAVNKLTRQSNGYYTISFVPKAFYGSQSLSLKQIGFLVKSLNGSKQSPDYFQTVGKLQLTLNQPAENSIQFLTGGSSYTITATTSTNATFDLKANGVSIYQAATPSTNFSYPYTVSGNKEFELVATAGTNVVTKKFTINEKPPLTVAPMPAYMQQGISYNPNDPTKVGLALYAPGKDFAYVIGSFNGWQDNSSSLMNVDSSNPKLFWKEITGLTPQQVYTFQYKTSDKIVVADPYSPLILSPDDDQWISPSTYPNKPTYPAGQRFDVSVIQTGMPNYPWKVANFTKPAKEKLTVYELLVRDFTEGRTWQSTIDKIPYLKGLGINAIELMPIMEFDGNDSWGYNPSFHYAIDKAYGTADKFKEFVDICHQNGIAVILDIALNHATRRNPLVRMWSTYDPSGYGAPLATNPFFNTEAKHAYSVFEDFNHSKDETKYYVKRVVEHWMKEYKIDGFRWDLTKGFTQNCLPSDENCTGSYQADRVAILKQYADYQWNQDPSSYVIFEHLGGDQEEQEWANYKAAEGKGVMMWNNLVHPYNETTMSWAPSSNIDRVNYTTHGFTEMRNMAYGESHDEERLMYKNLQYGKTDGGYNIKDLNTALDRMKGIGAILLAVPGPKMIWQFGELGYDFSINQCPDGTNDPGCRTSSKPVAFTLGYDVNPPRKAIYDTWAKVLNLKNANEIFESKTFQVKSGDLMPKIHISNPALAAGKVKNVAIFANYTTTPQNVNPELPFAGNWYDLMNGNNVISFATATTPVLLQPGEFRILGDAQASNLGTSDVSNSNAAQLQILENPASKSEIKIQYKKAKNATIYVYDLSGKMIHSQKAKSSESQESLRISGIKSGVYLIQLKSDNGAAVAKVIVK